MHATTRRLSALALVALLGPALPAARAAPPTPAEELLRFVPPDVSLCLVVRDLRGHAAALAESPFLEQLRRSPLGKQVQQTLGVQRLVADQFLQKYLRLDSTQLRDDILGDAVVVAYRLGPPG